MHEIEIAPPPFMLTSTIATISRSSEERRQWQAMGIIRFMELNGKTDDRQPSLEWSLRQTALFADFSDDDSRASWLLISVSTEAEDYLKHFWSSTDQDAHSSSRTLYALFHFAICNWRSYIVTLVQEVEQHEAELMHTSPDDSDAVPLGGSEQRKVLLLLERKTLDAKLAIQATKADICFLQKELTQSSRDGRHATWAKKFAEDMRQLDVNSMRLDQLHARISGITSLLSSFLDLSSGHALQLLTHETKMESQNMHKLNKRMADLAEKNAEEAVTVTVLAILGMIYLPLTVVSNFFSTSFVTTAPSNHHVIVTKDCWLLFVVATPLTMLTIYVWRVWTKLKIEGRYPFWWSLLHLKRGRGTMNDIFDLS
jgi:Mg2+ and Co2+ transporter CorA